MFSDIITELMLGSDALFNTDSKINTWSLINSLATIESYRAHRNHREPEEHLLHVVNETVDILDKVSDLLFNDGKDTDPDSITDNVMFIARSLERYAGKHDQHIKSVYRTYRDQCTQALSEFSRIFKDGYKQLIIQ